MTLTRAPLLVSRGLNHETGTQTITYECGCVYTRPADRWTRRCREHRDDDRGVTRMRRKWLPIPEED